MAKRKRDAARIPARAIEIIVRTDIIAANIPNLVPATSSAKMNIGFSTTSPFVGSNHHSPGIAAIMRKAIAEYKTVAIKRESMMPAGRFFSGFLTSPPIAATLVTPAYATNTNADASARDQTSVLSAPSIGRLTSKSSTKNAAAQMNRRRETVAITTGV